MDTDSTTQVEKTYRAAVQADPDEVGPRMGLAAVSNEDRDRGR